MLDTKNYEVAPGINYEYVFTPASDAKKATFLFLHGFPSSLYCWRHQIKYFSGQGYGCLAPNLMGYGKTYSPLSPEKYRSTSMVEHLLALLDHLKLEKVIVVGHDWGVRPASRFVLYHPDRTLGLVLVSAGYTAPSFLDHAKMLQMSKQALGYENTGYWTFFAADDAAGLIEQNVEGFLDLGFPKDPRIWMTDFAPLGKIREWITQGKRTERAPFLTEEDCRVLRQNVTEGMQPKLNWYRSVLANIDWNDEKDLDPTIDRPFLFIGGAKDCICLPKLFAEQTKYIADCESIELDSSHWIMEEQPEAVNQAISQWMKKLE